MRSRCSCGIASFPLLAFHAQTQGLLTEGKVSVIFAVAMLVDGLIGRVFNRRGAKVLLLVPVAASFAAVAFTHNVLLVWIGVAIWGVVNGILDSTIKAVVTHLDPAGSRATAFGWLALVRGIGLLVAGAVLGPAYATASPCSCSSYCQHHCAGRSLVRPAATRPAGTLMCPPVWRWTENPPDRASGDPNYNRNGR